MFESEKSESAISWEGTKENVLPLKRGRSTKGLGERIEAQNCLGSEIFNENGILHDFISAV